jgi:hypothetical protein
MITISVVEIFAVFGGVCLSGLIGGLCGILMAKLFNK